MKFGIFIYEGVEPIDLAAFGVLSMARRIRPEIEICTVAPLAGPVLLSNGLTVNADFGVPDVPLLDVLIVTGGPGWVNQARNDAVLAYLRSIAGRVLLTSVCTGGMILAASGVLDQKSATTKRHVVEPELPPIGLLRKQYPDIVVREGVFVDNGNVVTGGGVSFCIDTTLHLLEKLFDAHTASETARIMEYTYARNANLREFPPIYAEKTNDKQKEHHQSGSSNRN